MQHLKQTLFSPILLLQFVVVCGALFATGCSSSIRYVRDSDAPKITTDGKYVVPGNWDYRKYYKVPHNRLQEVINSWLGARYRFGGNSRKGVDCSGFVDQVFLTLNHVKLPHSSHKLRKMGRLVSKRDARAGDLIFFRTGIFRSVNHVGIYIENGRFAHASVKKGVIYSSIEEPYYEERFAEIRRIF